MKPMPSQANPRKAGRVRAAGLPRWAGGQTGDGVDTQVFDGCYQDWKIIASSAFPMPIQHGTCRNLSRREVHIQLVVLRSLLHRVARSKVLLHIG